MFIYHTGKERAIVGIARVVKAAYRDPSSDRAIWSAVDVPAVEPLANPVSLATIKADERFVYLPPGQAAAVECHADYARGVVCDFGLCAERRRGCVSQG